MGLPFSNKAFSNKAFSPKALIEKAFFRKRRSCLVGIDICSTAVKMLELGQDQDKIKLNRLAISPLQGNAFVDGEINDVVSVVSAVESLRARTHITCRDAAISVSGSTVVSKQVTMNAGLSELDMESQAWYEANKHFPDLIDNLCLDFQLQGINDKDPALVDVLLVACRKEKVEQHADVLEDAGFNPKIVDVDFYALQRAAELLTSQLADGGHDKTIAFINIGKINATFAVVRDGELLYTKGQPINGTQILAQACSKLDVGDWLTGYALKADSISDELKTELISIIIPSLVVQIRQLIQYFYSANNNQQIDQIVLSGEVAIVKGLEQRIQEQVNVPTIIANPFQDVAFSDDIDVDMAKMMAPAFMMCSGVARRGLQHD